MNERMIWDTHEQLEGALGLLGTPKHEEAKRTYWALTARRPEDDPLGLYLVFEAWLGFGVSYLGTANYPVATAQFERAKDLFRTPGGGIKAGMAPFMESAEYCISAAHYLGSPATKPENPPLPYHTDQNFPRLKSLLGIVQQLVESG